MGNNNRRLFRITRIDENRLGSGKRPMSMLRLFIGTLLCGALLGAFQTTFAGAVTVALSVETSATAPASVPMSATVTTQYPIKWVQFLVNGAVVAQVNTSPYQYTWTGITQGGTTGVAAGSYSITAQAAVVGGPGMGTSSATVLTVASAAAPAVAVTASASRAMLPASLTMNATVTSSYPVSALQFYVNGTATGSVAPGATGTYTTTVPSTVNATTVGSNATYNVTATAANAWSSTGTSNTATVNEVAHTLPTAAITSWEMTDNTPAELAAATTASDVDGIASVALSVNGTVQGTVTTAPYNFLISGEAAGNYSATATATNIYGQVSPASAPTSSLTVAASDPTITGDTKTQTRTTKYEYSTTNGRVVKSITEPESSDLCLVKTIGYDAFGNPNSSTTRNCNGSTPNEAPAPVAPDPAIFASRTNGVTYDSVGTYPLTKTNALSQSSQSTYDARFAMALTQTDANGLVSNQTLDSFGRPTLTTAPDGTQVQYQYTYCSGVNGGSSSCPTYGAYVVQKTPYASDGKTQIGAIKMAYFDTLGRVIQSQSQGFSGTTVLTTTNFDARGRVYQKSTPYFAGKTPSYTTTTYDVLNRKSVVTDVMGGTLTYSYNGVEATKVDGYGRSFTRTLNGRGQVIDVVDPAAQVTTYQYDPFGNLILSVDPQGVSKSMVYDIRGRKTQMTDPDMGTWAYTYDAIAEMVGQVDAKSQSFTMTYDLLGRMLSRIEPDLTSNWEYDVARSECTTGTGKAIGSQDRAWTSTGYIRIECVDTLERPVQERVTIGSNTYVSAVAYDASSRPITATYPAGSVYPSGFSVSSSYNSYGYLTQKTNTATGAVIWQANAMDALNDVTSESMAGSAFSATKTYDAVGRLVTSVAGSSNAIQSDAFVYDAIDGNLTSRSWEDSSGNSYSESFGYDTLNRLTSVTGPANKNYTYDYSGNITQKSDVGTYAYNPGTHQVSSITGTANGVTNPTFTYDANGNLLTEDGLTTAWSSYNMPTSLSRGAATDTFLYGPEHMRVEQVSTTSSGTVTTYYVGSSFEVVQNSATGTTEYHSYINSSTRRVAMLIDSTAGTTSWRYFHQDQISSVEVVTDQTGTLVERLSYDAFGRRRNVNGTDSSSFIIALDDRGYTDQEELDSIGMINMNGRVYDPTIGRFISADPTVQHPFDLQGHNRYAYVGNRPFINVDPTGFMYGPTGVHYFTNSGDATPMGFSTGSGIAWGAGNFMESSVLQLGDSPLVATSPAAYSQDGGSVDGAGNQSPTDSIPPQQALATPLQTEGSPNSDVSSPQQGQQPVSGQSTVSEPGQTIFGSAAGSNGSNNAAPGTAVAGAITGTNCTQSPCLNINQSQGLAPNQLFPGSPGDNNAFLAQFLPSGTTGLVVQQVSISGTCSGCTNPSGDSFYEVFDVGSGQTKDIAAMQAGSNATITLTATYYPNASVTDLPGSYQRGNTEFLNGNNSLPSSASPPNLIGPSSNTITRTFYFNFSN